MKKEKVIYDEMAIFTGYRRGYVKVSDRGIKTPVMIDEALRRPKNSNEYKFVQRLLDWGAVEIYREAHQHHKSNQYMYYIYTATKED